MTLKNWPPNQPLTRQLSNLRRAVWHARHGGIKQVREWRQRQRAQSAGGLLTIISGKEQRWGRRRRVTFEAAILPNRAPRRAELRVGVILDDFSRLALSYEWLQVELSRDQWASQLAGLDLLFVESAWAGNSGQWRYQLTGASGVKPDLVALLQECREQGIPTVFWNKEDPAHYDDFIECAKLFDVVMTTAEEKVAQYRKDLGHQRVHVMPFAAQPAIHNPIRPQGGWHERSVAFAGTYFTEKYPERRVQLDDLLGGCERAARRGVEVDIFSRHLGGEEKYQFPQKWRENVVGNLTYAQMLTAYKAYRVFLNVNSVVDSTSMCARRLFEIPASGTPVVTSASAATRNFFDETELIEVTGVREAENAIASLNSHADFANRLVHRAQRKIWASHTYSHRVQDVLDAVGIAQERPRQPSVSAIVASNRPDAVEHVFYNLGRQANVLTELVLVTHGYELASKERDRLAASYGVEHVTVITAEAKLSLGECLNLAVGAASGEVLSKMDDDDEYFEFYLSDLIEALEFSQAQIVGKRAHFVYLKEQDATAFRFGQWEHKFSSMVMGATITGHKEIFLDRPFTAVGRGEDTQFLKGLLADDGSIYSADRYNFCVNRGSRSHSWAMEDFAFLASAQSVLAGKAIAQIQV